MSIYDDFTYQSYLDIWEAHFGDADEGEFGFYTRGQRIPHTVRRLTPEEFEEHLEGMKAADAAFDQAMEAEDHEGMAKALADGFPHELALLI
jgi:hypothetical protein